MMLEVFLASLRVSSVWLVCIESHGIENMPTYVLEVDLRLLCDVEN